jgi:hypothetical protein
VCGLYPAPRHVRTTRPLHRNTPSPGLAPRGSQTLSPSHSHRRCARRLRSVRVPGLAVAPCAPPLRARCPYIAPAAPPVHQRNGRQTADPPCGRRDSTAPTLHQHLTNTARQRTPQVEKVHINRSRYFPPVPHHKHERAPHTTAITHRAAGDCHSTIPAGETRTQGNPTTATARFTASFPHSKAPGPEGDTLYSRKRARPPSFYAGVPAGVDMPMTCLRRSRTASLSPVDWSPSMFAW